MIPYRCYNRAGENPFACRGARIIVINRAAAWVKAVYRVPRGAVGAVCHSLVKLPVIKAGKRTLLINYSRKGVGKRGVFNSV